jgi:hypothetical protein
MVVQRASQEGVGVDTKIIGVVELTMYDMGAVIFMCVLALESLVILLPRPSAVLTDVT